MANCQAEQPHTIERAAVISHGHSIAAHTHGASPAERTRQRSSAEACAGRRRTRRPSKGSAANKQVPRRSASGLASARREHVPSVFQPSSPPRRPMTSATLPSAAGYLCAGVSYLRHDALSHHSGLPLIQTGLTESQLSTGQLSASKRPKCGRGGRHRDE